MTVEETAALMDRLRGWRLCKEEPEKCYQDSGPMCGEHAFNDLYVADMRAAAELIEAVSRLVGQWRDRGQALMSEPQASWNIQYHDRQMGEGEGMVGCADELAAMIAATKP